MSIRTTITCDKYIACDKLCLALFSPLSTWGIIPGETQKCITKAGVEKKWGSPKDKSEERGKTTQ